MKSPYFFIHFLSRFETQYLLLKKNYPPTKQRKNVDIILMLLCLETHFQLCIVALFVISVNNIYLIHQIFSWLVVWVL